MNEEARLAMQSPGDDTCLQMSGLVGAYTWYLSWFFFLFFWLKVKINWIRTYVFFILMHIYISDLMYA